MAAGHKRSARTAGMAEWMPKLLASYEAAQTTDEGPASEDDVLELMKSTFDARELDE